MTDDPVRRLAEADPAYELDPAPREDLLARILQLPRLPTAKERGVGRSRRRLGAPALALGLVVAVAGALLLIGPRGTRPLDLAAQAYAQTSAAPGQIVYTLADSVARSPLSRGPQTGTIEEWHRGAETHRIETWTSANSTRTVIDRVIDADGVMRSVTEDGTYRIVRRSDNEDAANVIAEEQAGFLEEFRRRYQEGQLDAAGDVQFVGRPARRYLVSADEVRGFPGPEQAFYIDRQTGAPLGYTSVLRGIGTINGTGTLRFVQTVRTIKRLDPTPENLKKLRTLSLPRRRDAEGCFRGPLTKARSSDTATKRDCGGTPGAPLPD